MKTKKTTGVELIAAERRRQIRKERWTPGHDDDHDRDQLALAAACYAIPKHKRPTRVLNPRSLPTMWPWHRQWWKPTPDDRVRELVKAGALIAAEIDRLQRRKP